MNKQQLAHYLKGGMFLATYNPKKMDISASSKTYIGKKMRVWQNMIISPVISVDTYVGQHAFNSDEIRGWFPEEDIEILEMVDEFIDDPQPLPQYMYRFYYTDEKKLNKNFGKNHGLSVPLIVGREYSIEVDDYVRKLSDPPADKIEKAVWNGEPWEEIQWKEFK